MDYYFVIGKPALTNFTVFSWLRFPIICPKNIETTIEASKQIGKYDSYIFTRLKIIFAALTNKTLSVCIY